MVEPWCFHSRAALLLGWHGGAARSRRPRRREALPAEVTGVVSYGHVPSRLPVVGVGGVFFLPEGGEMHMGWLATCRSLHAEDQGFRSSGGRSALPIFLLPVSRYILL